MSRLNRLAYANVAIFNRTLLRQSPAASADPASAAAGVNGSRSDHKVALPSSSLAAIPEGTVTNVASGSSVPNMSSALPSFSGAVKLSSAARVHQQSTQTTSSMVSGGGTAAAHDVSRSSLAGDGRSSSPKHSAGNVNIVAAAGRVQAVDNVIPPTVTAATSIKGPRLLFVVRHGERIDFTFGKDWMQNSFNAAGLHCSVWCNQPAAKHCIFRRHRWWAISSVDQRYCSVTVCFLSATSMHFAQTAEDMDTVYFAYISPISLMGSIVERLCSDLDRKEPRYKSPTLLYFTLLYFMSVQDHVKIWLTLVDPILLKFCPKVAHPLLIWVSETFDGKLWPNG